MPIVKVEMLPGRSTELKAEIARKITDVLIETAGGSRQHCIVLFEETSADNWAIGGDLVSSPTFAETQKAYKERLATNAGKD